METVGGKTCGSTHEEFTLSLLILEAKFNTSRTHTELPQLLGVSHITHKKYTRFIKCTYYLSIFKLKFAQVTRPHLIDVVYNVFVIHQTGIRDVSSARFPIRND